MATSTVPIVLSTLFEMFTEALGDVQVLYGDNGRDAERSNLVLTGDVEYTNEEWIGIGGQRREETYELDGFVQARSPAMSAQESLETAWDVMAAVETTLRGLVGPNDGTYPTLSEAVAAAFPGQTAQISDIGFRPKRGKGFPSPDGTDYQIDFVIEVTARI